MTIILAPPSLGWNLIAGNLALFAPLAVILAMALQDRMQPRAAAQDGTRRMGVVGRVVLTVTVLSLVVELGQLLVPGRTTSPYDVAMNAAGAAVAAAVALRLRQRGIPGGMLSGGAGAVVLVAVVVFLSATGFAADQMLRMAAWNPGYGLAAGQEVGGGREYQGTVTNARVCAGPSEGAVCVAVPSGGDPGEEVPPRERLRLQRAATGHQELTLSATVTSLVPQVEPARIVGFARDTVYRNASLAQEGRDVILRVRTPMGGPNGVDAEFLFRGVVEEGVETRLLASVRPGRVALETERARGPERQVVRWGILSGWTLVSGPVRRQIEPGPLLMASWVGAAALGLPLGLAVAMSPWAGGPLALLAGAFLPPALLFQLAAVFRLPSSAWEFLLAGGFGLVGVLMGRMGGSEPQ